MRASVRNHPHYVKPSPSAQPEKGNSYWIEIAQRLVAALHAFGVPDPQIDPAWFVDPNSIFGIGNYPYRIEIFCAIPGVAFDDCYARKLVEVIDGVSVPIISLDDLKANKRATARSQDLADLDHLP